MISGAEPSGKEGLVVGWGRTSEGGQLPAVVQEVRVPILSLTQCRGMKYRASRITNNMVKMRFYLPSIPLKLTPFRMESAALHSTSCKN